MLRLLPAILAATLTCGSAWAEPHEPVPGGCVSLETTKAMAYDTAKRDDGVFLAYDGDAAKKLIAAVNAIGKPTEFRADHVGVILVKSAGKGEILMGSDPCGYNLEGIVMHIPDIMKALVYAFGERL